MDGIENRCSIGQSDRGGGGGAGNERTQGGLLFSTALLVDTQRKDKKKKTAAAKYPLQYRSQGRKIVSRACCSLIV